MDLSMAGKLGTIHVVFNTTEMCKNLLDRLTAILMSAIFFIKNFTLNFFLEKPKYNQGS